MHCNGGDEDVASENLPQLPAPSLVLDVRPGVFVPKHNSARPDDVPVHEPWHECYAPSRLCRIRTKIKPRLSLDGTKRDTPHFISCAIDDPKYDMYLAQVELCFRFKRMSSDGTVTFEDLMLVRWMDDAPQQEDLGDIHVEADQPDPRPSWQDQKRAILATRVSACVAHCARPRCIQM